MIFQPIIPLNTSFLEFYLTLNHFGEYELPKYSGLRIKQEFDSYEAYDIIAQSGLVENQNSEIDKVVDKIYQIRKAQVTPHSNFISDQTTDIYQFTIWHQKEKSQDELPKWLEECYYSALTAMEEASGDDDYYDYMPSYVELVADILNLTGNKSESEYLITKLQELPE
jgi:hypothetical protein